MTEAPQLRLTNTLTKIKDVFQPIDAHNVRMYVCGPTVYDFAHIGNARPVIVFDVLFRLLRHLYGAEHVTYVRNITDVDDKINARALRDFPDLPLNEAIRKVTERTATQFHEDVAALGCLAPTHEPRATEFVLPRADGKADMVSLIQSLIDRGHAYATISEILFDTVSMADYGNLSGRNLDDQRAGARVAVDADKKNPGDFVLWKASSDAEPGWDGSFTIDGKLLAIRGRPGWHIECSAMAAAYLGEVFDIHGGGLDLIFPHHENEIAQSRCAHGTDVMANYWLHNGFVQVEGRKMSKSEGNFVTIHDLLHTEQFGGRKWPGEVLRLAMLMTHYREPIDFSVRRLEEAEGILNRLYLCIGDVEATKVHPRAVDQFLNDLNIGNASAILKLLEDDAATGASLSATGYQGKAYPPASILKATYNLLGLLEMTASQRNDLKKADLPLSEDEILQKISDRLSLIAAKNWAEADRIRDQLLAQGIQLKDGKDAATGERVTTWEVKR